MKPTIHSLPYFSELQVLCENLKPLEDLVILHSTNSQKQNGRWTIIGAKPLEKFDLNQCTSVEQIYSQSLALYNKLPQHKTPTTPDLPFTGGLLGLISYDAIKSADLANLKKASPTIYVGLYTWAFLVNHAERKSYLIHWPKISDIGPKKLIDLYHHAHNNHNFETFTLTRPFEPLWSFLDYKAAFNKVQSYIKAGDTYQVNLAQTFCGHFAGEPLAAFFNASHKAQVPYACYFDKIDNTLIGLSPEQFIGCSNNKLETKPIKGTRPRSDNPSIDEYNKEALGKSEKDRAENLMIVDLLRNDISKNASNVTTPLLFNIETYPTVYHLVSTVKGQLNKGSTPLKAFLDAFPGGSITGAPKKRAMEIIDELEEGPRELYCGSAFYWSNNNNFDSNILIRSFILQGDEIRCWGGGGIVADSKLEAEYQESFDKVSRLMEWLESKYC